LERDKIVNYYKIDRLNKNSPLFLSIEFLKKFIDTFDYNSTFYYPLMCIDSGVFRIICKKDKIYELSTYGLNMFSIDLIRKHLNNLIPNIIIISKNMDNTYYCDAYEGIGLVTLNGNSFGDDIIKEIGDKNDRNHKAFVLSKNIFHESFGHNKSCFSKDSNLYNSQKCFKDKNGQLRYLTKDNENPLFEYIKNIDNSSFEKLFNDKKSGDSGYFLEFFFGEIEEKNVKDIIDEIEEKTNLGILLDVDLWHNKIVILKKFVELRYKIINTFIDLKEINLDYNIYEQI
jgi:hypothetical protein